eukprot:TRINITY_DN14127_c0_g1_i3.p1 TRINITY_DN14127_c0_g1~~TRINITY_DN14127_c0_g1_i3.p1  ORF type:complete len:246 (-),score=61.52 TRINITY_DN14127_c0_g1_i3:610-1347(-)
MGCTNSSDQKEPKEISVTKTDYSRPKVDVKDYEFVGETGQVLLKKPGSINGLGPFTLKENEDCDIFLLDWSDCVNIYRCKNCRIFVGPVAGSIQFKDSVDCTIVAACQQFRPSNCTDCSALLFVVGDPGMVMCTGFRYGCFQFSYPELQEQFAKAELCVHNNRWSRVHDFVSKDGSKYSDWSYLPHSDPSSVLPKLSQVCADQFGPELEAEESSFKSHPVVPLTIGKSLPWNPEVPVMTLVNRVP